MAPILPSIPFKKQAQVAQLELKFAAPLTNDEQVGKFADLLKLKFNYLHKLVWVREHTCYYFLVDGDGTLPIHWKRHWNVSTIEMYDPNKDVYLPGEVCYLNGVIYRAKKEVPKGTTPAENGEFWQIIAGESITVRHLFDNTPTVIVSTSIRNPMFQVFIGTLPKDSSGDYLLDENGMVKIENPEPIDVDFVQQGNNYTFNFYEDEQLKAFSGIINIK